MRKKRIYVDSSAVGGVFNDRIAEQTEPFWNAVERGEVTVIVSDVLDEKRQKPHSVFVIFWDPCRNPK